MPFKNRCVPVSYQLHKLGDDAPHLRLTFNTSYSTPDVYDAQINHMCFISLMVSGFSSTPNNAPIKINGHERVGLGDDNDKLSIPNDFQGKNVWLTQLIHFPLIYLNRNGRNEIDFFAPLLRVADSTPSDRYDNIKLRSIACYYYSPSG